MPERGGDPDFTVHIPSWRLDVEREIDLVEEIARLHGFDKFANTLPDHQRIRGSSRKWLLKRAFGNLVPPEVFNRFKRGFDVPISRWLRNELREYYQDCVLSPQARINRYLQMPNVEACFRDHLRHAHDYSGLLWRCLVLEIWLRHFERRFEKPNSRSSLVDNAMVHQEICQAT